MSLIALPLSKPPSKVTKLKVETFISLRGAYAMTGHLECARLAKMSRKTIKLSSHVIGLKSFSLLF